MTSPSEIDRRRAAMHIAAEFWLVERRQMLLADAPVYVTEDLRVLVRGKPMGRSREAIAITAIAILKADEGPEVLGGFFQELRETGLPANQVKKIKMLMRLRHDGFLRAFEYEVNAYATNDYDETSRAGVNLK